MALPVIVCLKSEYNNKYLRYRHDDNSQAYGLLQFSGETPFDPLAQFQVVNADCGDGLVHLKSLYTNKYFVRWTPKHFWITPGADLPNENKSEWSCTLLKPVIIEDNGATKKARLLHVELDHYVGPLGSDSASFYSCLFAGSKNDTDTSNIVTILDWSNLFKLPKHVAFKCDDGQYLGAFPDDNSKSSLRFSFDDPNDPKVAHEVFESPGGTVSIKSKYYGKFWRADKNDVIVADVTEPDDLEHQGASAMFRLKVIDINVVALLNCSDTLFCKRYSSTQLGINLLKADTKSVDEFAILKVIDLEN